MKLTKKLQAEILKIYNTYWDAYLAGDMKTFASMLDDNIKVFGTAVSEVFNNKTETVRFYKATADQMTGKAEFRNRKIKMNPVAETVLIHEQSNLFVLIENEWIFYSPVRVSAIFVSTPKGWKLTHQHGSFPDSRAEAGEQIAPEKIRKENLELREAIKRRTVELENKNRELEIEASLEKVRTIAMGMRKPDDMLDVCKAISLQLQSLGVKEIRNLQTAIFYEQRGTYMNYEYYSMHDKTIITETVFTNNKIHNDFATKMMRGKGENFITHIKGSKVKDWIAYQKTTNVFIDKYLETASSLNYYWFSLGPVALGISTYQPLKEEEINLFKRFLKVFGLAYQRYLDIEQAEAQAREAQIEASLERVRAVAMGMNKSDDLLSICEVSFNEFKKLGIDYIRNALIHIQYDNQKYFMDYDFSDLTGGAITKIEYGTHPVVEDYLKQIRSAKDAFYQGIIEENQLEEWKDFRRNSGQIDDPRLDKATALYYYFFSIGIGDIGISTLKSIDESQIKILKRFRNVFDLAYRRYGDIALAEAQARESQIELALERVRARTMAMQHSEELQETSYVLFEQLCSLGETAEQLSIGIFNENRGVIELSVTLAGSKLPKTYEVPFDEPFIMGKAYQAWKEKKKSFVYELSGKTLKDYNQYRNRVFGGKLSSKEKTYTKRIVYFAFFSNGVISFSSHEERPSETIFLIERFAAVFDLTYTRFNDLKKAEEQAREAKIEVALERIRARATAMHTSDELMDVATILREQMGLLGQPELETCVVDLFEEDSDRVHSWYAFRQPELASGKIVTGASSFSWQSSELTREMMMIYRSGQKECTLEVEGAKANEFFQVLVKASPEIIQYVGESIPNRMCYNITFFSGGALLMVSYQPPSDEAKSLQRRAAFVFEMAYRRYLDLKKAEAQAREAKIEAALERVRSRTMGMQKSEELKDVIRVVYEQFVHLKIHVDHAGFVVDYTPKGDWHFWIADEQEIPSKITHPYFESVWANQFNEAKEKSADFFATKLNYEEKNKFYNVLLSYIPGLPEASKDFYLNCPGLAASTVLLKNVSLYIENFSGIPYSDEDNNTLMRFGIVFQQTYTRFLDLQKAEAQAREAEIELSLERVRSKAMAMHSPNDLSETVNVFFKELKTLGIIPIRCGVGQIDEATRTTSLTTTTSSQQGDSFQVIGKVKQTGHPVLDGIFDHWKLQKEYHPVLEGEDIKAYYDVMNAQIGYPEYPEGVTQYGNTFFFNEGFVFAWTQNLLSEEELIIFRRFTSVLGLTYRRYMDLKEAEAQAREAQIEASLERVRSRTMAMQRSDELAETVSVLFKQLLHLGVKSTQLRTCGISTFKENERLGEIWITDITGEIIGDSFIAPYDEAPAYKTIYSKWKSGEKFLELNLKGDAFLEHLNFVKKYSAVPNINLDEIKKLYTEIFINVIYFSQGYLFIISYEALTEFHGIFKRFGALFHQTYTRFLDFKKVEAQAREAQIEAALERVRSKAMAMHSSEDLAITVDTFFSELNNLNVTPHRCGMGIIDEQSKIVAIHATTVTHDNEVKKIKGNLKLAGHPVLDSIFDNWKLQKEYHPVLRGNEIIEYYKVMNPQVSFPDFAGDETQYGYYFFFKEGGVFAWTDKELADGDLQIFRRYTSVLSLTYRRYKDLKEAEAQAREAKIEVAMEKVRARAMAMQKPGQLVEVAQLLRMEMSLLGVEELETSSIYVHDSASGVTECWYAIQDIREQNKKLVTDHMTLRLDDTWVGREMMKFYTSNQKQTSILMQGENRKEWINYCADHSKVLQGYYGDVIPERTYHLLKFSNGFMGAASPGDLSEESWSLLNRATNVFSLAYTRFLDLQKAEAQTREAQIELALERVRARTMAMHKSDELAETAAVIFKQLITLGVEPNRIYLAIIKDGTGNVEFWITDEDGNKVSTGFKANLVENNSFNKMFEGWKKQEKCLTIDMQRKELEEYFNHLNKINVPFKDGLSQNRRIQNIAYFSKGFIGIASPDLLPNETIDVLKRFAAVFNLTYTRFNDLQQAEAQNKIIQAENERKTKELEEARQLQLSMLPKELPLLPHLDIAVYMKPATEVGGDYYDFNICNDGTLTILVCDATGHGMMSGMMVSIMKSIFISNRNNIDLKEFFENTNNSLKEMHLGRLMMASLGVQITSDKVIATNAGMPSLLYFRNKSKKAGEFVSNNLPLGAMRGIKYSLKEIKYEKGDTLLLMSDGFAELRNENNEQYGYNRVKEEFRSVAQKKPNEIVEHLKDSAAQWIKGIEPDDDVTFVVIKVK